MFFASVFFPFTAFLRNLLIDYLDAKTFDDIRCWQIQTVWILCSQLHVFGLINSSPNAQRNLKRAREEPSLSANVGRIWCKTYVFVCKYIQDVQKEDARPKYVLLYVLQYQHQLWFYYKIQLFQVYCFL